MSDYCVGCDRPITLQFAIKECSCCREEHAVMSYHCVSCGLSFEIVSAPAKHILTQRKKRGIGKTN